MSETPCSACERDRAGCIHGNGGCRPLFLSNDPPGESPNPNPGPPAESAAPRALSLASPPIGRSGAGTLECRTIEIGRERLGRWISIDDLVAACCREAMDTTLSWLTDNLPEIYQDGPAAERVVAAYAPPPLSDQVAFRLIRDWNGVPMVGPPKYSVAVTKLRGGVTLYTLAAAECDECQGDGGDCRACGGKGVAMDVEEIAAGYESPFVEGDANNLGRFVSRCCAAPLLTRPESRITCLECERDALPDNWRNPGNSPRLASFLVL